MDCERRRIGMKRGNLWGRVIFVCILCVVFEMFMRVQNFSGVQSLEEQEKQEITLDPIVIDEKKVVGSEHLDLNNIRTNCLEEEPTMENYMDHADAIIKGEVVGIQYFDCNGLPWSRLTIVVSKVIQGELEKGQKIVVYVMEGYRYTDSSEQDLIAVTGDDMGLHEIGDVSFFVIDKEDGDNVFEEGSYRRSCSCFSEYRYMETKDSYNVFDSRNDESIKLNGLSENKLEKRIESMTKISE